MNLVLLMASAISPASSDDTTVLSDVVDNVGGMASLLDQYGPTLVILSIFLLIFIGMIVIILKMNGKMNSQMIENQKQINDSNQRMMQDMFDACMAIVRGKSPQDESTKDVAEDKPPPAEKKATQDDETAQPSEDETSPRKTKKLISAYIDSNLAFKDASRIAMSKTRCDRIAIYLFHNGNHTPYGFPFIKMSCVHEWTTRGSNTIRGYNHMNIPLYAFSSIVESLNKDDEFAIGNMYDHSIISPDEQVYSFISGSSIKAMFALAIRDAEGELAAFTIAEFKTEQDFASSDIYNTVKGALGIMNDNIRSIILNEQFRNTYAKGTETT